MAGTIVWTARLFPAMFVICALAHVPAHAQDAQAAKSTFKESAQRQLLVELIKLRDAILLGVLQGQIEGDERQKALSEFDHFLSPEHITNVVLPTRGKLHADLSELDAAREVLAVAALRMAIEAYCAVRVEQEKAYDRFNGGLDVLLKAFELLANMSKPTAIIISGLVELFPQVLRANQEAWKPKPMQASGFPHLLLRVRAQGYEVPCLATTGLNVRTEAKADAEIVCTLNKSDVLLVGAECAGGWYKVRIPGMLVNGAWKHDGTLIGKDACVFKDGFAVFRFEPAWSLLNHAGAGRAPAAVAPAKLSWTFAQALSGVDMYAYSVTGSLWPDENKAAPVVKGSNNNGIGCSAFVSAILHRMRDGDKWLSDSYDKTLYQLEGHAIAAKWRLVHAADIIGNDINSAGIKRLLGEGSFKDGQLYLFAVRIVKADGALQQGHTGFVRVNSNGGLQQWHYSQSGGNGGSGGLLTGDFVAWYKSKGNPYGGAKASVSLYVVPEP